MTADSPIPNAFDECLPRRRDSGIRLRTALLFATMAILICCSSENSDPDTPSPARCSVAREFTAYPISAGAGADCSDFRFTYPEPELSINRSTRLLIEIDRTSEIDIPQLKVTSHNRSIDLVSLLDEVGLQARIVVSDVLPSSRLTEAEALDDPFLRSVVRRYRNESHDPDEWSIYLLLRRRRQRDAEISGVIQGEPGAAVVSLVNDSPHPGVVLHAIVHEIGHLLNLPHPWDVYGNTRSAMTYPWRWSDWDWSDLSLYRFDAAGRRHIMRAPDICVDPASEHQALCPLGLSAASSTDRPTPSP